MNDSSLDDPQLLSLEARLAALAPHVSRREQQELLYRCAFAAGQKRANRIVRRWQAASLGLAVLMVGMAIPLARGPRMIARQPAQPPVPQQQAPRQPIAPQRSAPEETRLAVRPLAHVELGAWQVERTKIVSLADELAQFDETDPRLRSLTVGTLTRAALAP